MELRQLQLFIAAAEEGSITAASRRMNLTQPALSRQIKALEEELEVELFTRGAHSVTLTPAGRLLVAEGGKLLERADRVVKQVRAEAVGEPLRIGFAPSLAGPLLGMALERFSQVHPNARVELSDCSSAEMRDGLARGRFDVVVTVPWEGDGQLMRWETIRRHEMRLAVPHGHPFAKRKSVKMADLDGEKLLLYSRTEYPEYWQSISKLFREHGIDAKVGGEFDGVSSLCAAIQAGLGVAFVAAGSEVERVATIRVKPDPGGICVSAGLLGGKEESPVIGVFIGELRAAAAELEGKQ